MTQRGEFYFLTGTTGNALSPLPKILLDANSYSRVAILTRDFSKVDKLSREFIDYPGRFFPIIGDVSDSLVIHDENQRRHVMENSTVLLNGAGNVRFNDTPINLSLTNILGRENFVSFAGKCWEAGGQKLKKAFDVSTVYACEMNGKEAKEEIATKRDKLPNEYVKSKLEGELLMYPVMNDASVPYSTGIIRSGIIVDPSCVTFNQYYALAAAGHLSEFCHDDVDLYLRDIEYAERMRNRTIEFRGLKTRLWGNPFTKKQFMTPEEASNQIAQILMDSEARGVYHVAGKPTITGKDISDSMSEGIPSVYFEYAGENSLKDLERRERVINFWVRPFRDFVTQDNIGLTRTDALLERNGYVRNDLSPESFLKEITNPFALKDLRDKSFLKALLEHKAL